MGNSGSRTNDLDSDEDGGSDYEHAYNYHTSVFRKSPADGFESDYDDDDHDPSPTGGKESSRAVQGGSGVRRDGGDNAGREGGGSDEGEESYETAGEGSGEEAESEGGSFSTITSPRTRPQSDSEYTATEVDQTTKGHVVVKTEWK
ncbi:hypothetical protein ACOMHN_060699 [Nucella lapillus]